MRVAVVDLGTNSTRLLVADVENGRVRELERRSTVTRLGDRLEETGALGEESIGRVFEALGHFRELIDSHAAEHAVAVATSAVREAGNGEEFRRELAERFELDARAISGEEEARLTFRGATAGRAADDGELMVIDIGGGSTELMVGRPGAEPRFHVSTLLGSVRHSERHLDHDPPAPEELDALEHEAREVVAAEVPEKVRRAAKEGIAVSGTPSSLAGVELGSDESVEGHRLTSAGCRALLAKLAALPLSERRQLPGLHPDRAPTIVAGAAILVHAIEAFELDSIAVSSADLLHGAALDRAAEDA